MSANVALTDTFDQWRVKTNEVVVMTQTDGMSNFIKLLDTTNSTSNTTGSIITAGGVGIAKSAVIGENLRIHGNLITDGDTTISGNLVFGDATTDQVTFTADINSSLIPNANLTFNIGNTLNQWANVWVGHTGITQTTASGKPALSITSQDVDQIAVSITASQTTADVLDIVADSVADGKVIDIAAGALTTGSALYIDSDSGSTGTRSIAKIVQNHASAVNATGLTVQADAGKGIFIDTDLADGGPALEIDAEQATTTAVDINVDAATSANAVSISADLLSTGSAFTIDSDSSSTGIRNIAQIIQNHASATGATALALQADAGRGLFIDTNLAAGGYALEVDAEQTTTNTAKIAAVSTSGTTLEISSVGVLTGKVIDITADAATTGRGINMSMDGLTTGSALYIDSDSSSTGTRSIATIIQNHASATGSTGLTVQADAGRGVFIDTNLAAGGYSLEVDSEQTTTNVAKIASIATSGTVLEVSQAGIMTGKVIDITADAATTGTGINMSMDGLTTGSALVVDSNSSDTGTRNIASITQNHASAVNSTTLALVADAGRGLFIDTNLAAGGYSLEVDAEQTTTNTAKIAAVSTSGTTLEVSSVGVLTGKVIDITADAATTGTGINMSMDGLTTGSALAIASDSSSTGTRNIASIIQDHSSASGSTTLYLRNDHATADALAVVGAVTVGVNDVGHDVKFFGATSGAYMLWDESADDLILSGTAQLSIDNTADASSTTTGSFHTDGGVGIAKKLYVGTDLAVDGTSNLDAVDIDGTTQIDGTVTVGVNDTGYDVKFFGADSGKYLLWDESANALHLPDNVELKIGSDSGGDCMIYHNTADTYINNKTGRLMLATATSGVGVIIGHTTSEVTVNDNLTVTGLLTESSFRDLKTNIEPIENILPAVLKLQGVSFDWKDDEDPDNNYGFIAEDVHEVLPNLVSYNEEGKPHGVQYSKMTAVLLEAIKEQQIQIDELKAKLN